ncbi:FkbM family methyltransferase [Methanothrix sp.]|uniref:FkbM family methyltransferase n=1 Tax=Methanothrix sp. TaxID=90426 RepID=UPI0032994927
MPFETIKNCMKRSDTSKLVHSAYYLLLGRDPDPEGYAHWTSRIKSGMNRDEFISAIIQSDEFKKSAPAWSNSDLWRKCQILNAEICLNLSIGKFCGPAVDDSVFASILEQNGAYEPHVAAEITRLLKPGETFIDIGANLGYFTLIASQLVGPSGKVLSFEPVPMSFDYLQKNVKLNNLYNVKLYKNGLWNKNTVLTITDSDNIGYNHIAENGIEVECIYLDSLQLRPNLIKMDIEGAEPYALQGMIETLERHHPTIVMEVNRFCLRTFIKKDAIDIWEPLHDQGYEMAVIPSGQKIESIEQLNALCPEHGLIDIRAEMA